MMPCERLGHLGRGSDHPPRLHRPDVGCGLEPLQLPLGLGDQDADANDLHDRRVVPPRVAAVLLEHGLLVRVDLAGLEAVVPPVRVARHHPQEVLFAVAADHDGRDRIGPGLAVGAGDLVVLALVARGPARPHRPDQLDGLGELGDAHRRGRERPAVRAVLLLVPARADPQDDAATREHLGRRDHLREQRGIAKAIAQDLVAAELVRIATERIREQAPALGHLVAAVLHVIGKPERVERAARLIEVRERVLHQARPHVEADGHRHRCLLPGGRGSQNQRGLSTTFLSGCPLMKRRQLSSRMSKRRSSRYGPKPAVWGVMRTPGSVHSG